MTESSLEQRLRAVQAQVADAAAAAGRSADELTTIVVTKFHPASLVRELAALGVTDFGENRVQEAAPKAAELADLGLDWHFIGQLQSNKARTVVDFASAIHSVDRPSLVTALGGAALDVFLQLNLTDDPDRGGVQPDGLLGLGERVLSAGGLRLRGVMAVAPLGEDPRPAFARVRAASEQLRTLAPGATALSMGMSGDFPEAIAEGATHLRIGTAITGNRPDRG